MKNPWGKIPRVRSECNTCHLEPFGALRINSVRDLFLILFSKEASWGRAATKIAPEIHHEGREQQMFRSQEYYARLKIACLSDH
jgi:hypothetical protein